MSELLGELTLSASFYGVLKASSQSVLTAHNNSLKKLKDEIAHLRQANEKLQKENERLETDFQLATEKCRSEREQQLSGTANRLGAPCGGCRVLLQQLEQQQSLFSALLQQKDTSLTALLEKHLGPRLVSGSAGSTRQLLQDLSQAVHDSQHPQAPAQPSQAPAQHPQAAAQHPQAPPQHPQAQAQHSQSPAQHPQAPAQHPQAPAQHPQAPADVSDSREVSPTGHAKLKLTRPTKRHLYVQEGLPESKRVCAAPPSPCTAAPSPPPAASPASPPPRNHVPETCAWSPGEAAGDQSDTSATRRRHPSVVPETVAELSEGGQASGLAGSDIVVSSDDEQPAHPATLLYRARPLKIVAYKHRPSRGRPEPVRSGAEVAGVTGDSVRAPTPITLSLESQSQSDAAGDSVRAPTPITLSSESQSQADAAGGSVRAPTPLALSSESQSQSDAAGAPTERPALQAETVAIQFGSACYSVGVEANACAPGVSPPASPVFGAAPLHPADTLSASRASLHLPSCDTPSLPRASLQPPASSPRLLAPGKPVQDESPPVLSGKPHTKPHNKPHSKPHSRAGRCSPRGYAPLQLLSDSAEKPGPSRVSTAASPHRGMRASPRPSKSPAKITRLLKRNDTSPHKLELSSPGGARRRLTQITLSARVFHSSRASPRQRAKLYNGAREEELHTQQEEAWLAQATAASLRETVASEAGAAEAEQGPTSAPRQGSPGRQQPARATGAVGGLGAGQEPGRARERQQGGGGGGAPWLAEQSLLLTAPQFTSTPAPRRASTLATQHAAQGDPVTAAEATGLDFDEALQMVTFSDLDRVERAKDTEDYFRSLRGVERGVDTAAEAREEAGLEGSAGVRTRCGVQRAAGRDTADCADSAALGQEWEDSFDVAPRLREEAPGYKYVEVVRNQAERRQLQAKACDQCQQYFSGLGVEGAELQERLRSCRHRARHLPPDTPEHYWEVDFPDTQEARERGYLNVTQAKPSRARRRRPLKKLFQAAGNTDG